MSTATLDEAASCMACYTNGHAKCVDRCPFPNLFARGVLSPCEYVRLKKHFGSDFLYRHLIDEMVTDDKQEACIKSLIFEHEARLSYPIEGTKGVNDAIQREIDEVQQSIATKDQKIEELRADIRRANFQDV